MKRIALTVCLLLTVVAVTAGGEPPPEPIPEQVLHFRLDAGVEPGHAVAGYLDESKGAGKGYDRVTLDLDGDGTFETVQEAPMQEDSRSKKLYPKLMVTIDRDGAKWVLDLYSMGRSRPTIRDGKVVTYIRWSVTSDDIYAWFINGRVTLYGSAAAAKAGETIRLGPPFKFDTGSSRRGPDALVRVGLKDSHGCTMRLARRDKTQQKIRVLLTSGGKEILDTHAAYG